MTEVPEKTGPKLNMKQNIILNQIIAAYVLDGVDNSLCKNHTIKYKQAIRLFEPWALKSTTVINFYLSSYSYFIYFKCWTPLQNYNLEY